VFYYSGGVFGSFGAVDKRTRKEHIAKHELLCRWIVIGTIPVLQA